MNRRTYRRLLAIGLIFAIFNIRRIILTQKSWTAILSHYPIPLLVHHENFSDVLLLEPIIISDLLCENPLTNLTDGAWARKIDFVEDENLPPDYETLRQLEEKMDKHLSDFRIKRGIHTRLWRDDHKCGLANLQDQPARNHFGKPAGSWCDAKSDRPCCSDENGGMCLRPSRDACSCPRCVDMRSILHAELSEWLPTDARCRRRHYNGSEACNVLQRFSEIHFVGDSFIRKLARAIVLTLRSNPMHGADFDFKDSSLRQLCQGPNQFYWTECKLLPESGQIQTHLVDSLPLCRNPEVPIYLYEYYDLTFAENFHTLIRNINCKPKSVVILAVGGHMECDAQLVIDVYLHPAIKYLKTKCRSSQKDATISWPKVLFLYPDMIGLMKSPSYRKTQGKFSCVKFAANMKKYCDDNGVAVLDFRKMTTGVHSYDGAHYGIGVNMMKTQILLNYLDSLHSKNVS